MRPSKRDTLASLRLAKKKLSAITTGHYFYETEIRLGNLAPELQLEMAESRLNRLHKLAFSPYRACVR